MDMLHFQFLQKLKRLPGIFHFKKNLRIILPITCSSNFRIDPHATFVAPIEDKKITSPSPTPSPPGERKKRIKPLPRSGEGKEFPPFF